MSAGRMVLGWWLLPPQTETTRVEQLAKLIPAVVGGPIAVLAGLLAGHAVAGIIAGALLSVAALPDEESPAETRRQRVRRCTAYEPARFGLDGIGFGREGFIPYGVVTEVDKVGDRLVVNIGSEPMFVFEIPLEDWLTVDELIEHGRTKGARVAADPELEATLRRHPHEDEATWLARAESAARDGGYRTMTIDRSRLWRVARDVDAEPSARAAACTLLGRVVDIDEHRAWTALYETTAHPAVRAALEAMVGDAEARP